MKLFDRKPAYCSICKKKLDHKHKPKREWDVEGPLCSNCYINEMQKYYDHSIKQKCVICGTEKNVPDLWEPRYQWEMKGLLCKICFDKKEESYNKIRSCCNICGVKLGTIRYNPKKHWTVEGYLCRNCWDAQKAQKG